MRTRDGNLGGSVVRQKKKKTEEVLLERRILEKGQRPRTEEPHQVGKKWLSSGGRRQETQRAEDGMWISWTACINNLFIAVGYTVVWLWFSWKRWKREHAMDRFWRSEHSLSFGLLWLQLGVASTRKVTSAYTYNDYRGKLYCAIKLV